MGRVLLCMGRYAKKPYFMERAYINVFSVEELCYCFIENACLIGQEAMDGELSDWLDRECGMGELAGRLKKLEKKGSSISTYTKTILEYVGYGSREQQKQALLQLEKSLELNVYEKRKARADYLAEHGKYIPALKSYDSLLQELPQEERALRAGVLHNRGVAYAGLFCFESAAESFREAFAWGAGEDSFTACLAAKRMALGETEYVDFVAARTEDHEQLLRVERLMEQAVGEFEGTRESRMLFTLRVCREEGKNDSYYEEIKRIVGGLKEKYREMTAE